MLIMVYDYDNDNDYHNDLWFYDYDFMIHDSNDPMIWLDDDFC